MARKTKKEKEAERKTEEARQHKENQKKEHNKILKWTFGIFGIVVIAALIMILVSHYGSSFTYQGIQFNVVKFCDSSPCLVTYMTSLPVRVIGNITRLSWPFQKTNDYNFYLKKDPRKSNVIFNGTLHFTNSLVLKTEDDFICNGEGAVAGANLAQLYQILGENVSADKNATCDPFGRYTLLDIRPENQTSIYQTGPTCYVINVKDCEILDGTEKFMVETLARVNQVLNNQTNILNAGNKTNATNSSA